MSTPNVLPSPAPATPQPSRKRRWPWIVGAVVAGLFVIGLVTPSAPVTSSTPSSPTYGTLSEPAALSDVSISQCTPNGSMNMAQVTAQVHNGTASAQSYVITVSLNDATGNRVAEANGAANSLAPGQSAQVALIGESAPGATACTVANVTRIPV